nr:extensin family protein [Roseibium denhamense]
MKPLGSGTGHGFVEGVDTPAAKPSSAPKVEKGADPAPDTPARTQTSACVIPGVELTVRSPVDGENGCGFSDAVEVTAVEDGDARIAFSGPVTITCEFAKVFAEWLRDGVMPASEKHLNSESLLVMTGPGYQCRRRNNLPDGKLSEHALGKAVDISGFVVPEGQAVSVEKDWNAKTEKGRFLTDIHASACTHFTTVLGPDADPHHVSHIHLDTGCHGKACDYLICQ